MLTNNRNRVLKFFKIQEKQVKVSLVLLKYTWEMQIIKNYDSFVL